MTLALVLFAIAAIGGILLATLRVRRGANPPTALALAHGGAATAGLLALIVVVRGPAPDLATSALMLFLLAAVGGIVLFVNQLRGTTIPLWLVVVHASVALIAFFMLMAANAG